MLESTRKNLSTIYAYNYDKNRSFEGNHDFSLIFIILSHKMSVKNHYMIITNASLYWKTLIADEIEWKTMFRIKLSCLSVKWQPTFFNFLIDLAKLQFKIYCQISCNWKLIWSRKWFKAFGKTLLFAPIQCAFRWVPWNCTTLVFSKLIAQ